MFSPPAPAPPALNLNSRLRDHFTPRCRLGAEYLNLLQFLPKHRRLMRGRRAESRGKSPREPMTGQGRPHWLTLPGLGPLQPHRTRSGEVRRIPNKKAFKLKSGPRGTAISARVCNPESAASESRRRQG